MFTQSLQEDRSSSLVARLLASQESSPTTLRARAPSLFKRRAMTTPTFTPPPFVFRRGSHRFSSGRFGRSSLRMSGRSRSSQRSLLSLKGSRQPTARPSRTKAVFESLLSALVEGIDAVRGCVEEMKGQMPLDGTTSSSRVNYYLDLEKQIKSLDRKIRTLEVHKDRVEEMRDEYALKKKLREGAFNLAQALASQTSKDAKEKLQQVRTEQRDLLEDLCDIEEELETKLGVFHVRIMGLAGLSHGTGLGGGEGGGEGARLGGGGGGGLEGGFGGLRGGDGGSGGALIGGDSFEVQLKLCSQKWKSRCKLSRGQQLWQDSDIIFLGKVNDELFVKVLGIRRIQGNTLVGCVKCQTRQLFSFYPQNVTFAFPTSSHLRLNVGVHWSPVLGDDFLSSLHLPTLPCLVGGLRPQVASVSHVEKLHLYPNEPQMMGLSPDTTVHQIRVLTESDDVDSAQSRDSFERKEVKTSKVSLWRPRLRREVSDNEDFEYMDRKSLQDPLAMESKIREYPGLEELIEGTEGRGGGGRKEGRGAAAREEEEGRGEIRPILPCSSSILTLSAALEAVLFALEEPLEQYPELKGLELQLQRLESALKGAQLVKAPSMTLSESQALDSFDFLGGTDDAHLLQRMSRISFSDGSEGHFSPSPIAHSMSSSDGNKTPTSIDKPSISESHDQLREEEGGTVGDRNIDAVLIQHLLHCEYLLQHLQSSGPLNFRLTTALVKLQREAEVVAELLNMAADPEGGPPEVERVLPELAANTELMRFWRIVSKDNPLYVRYEVFALGLDSNFGQLLWEDCPEVGNRVFAELLGRILDLDVEFCGAIESDMVVTVFQYSSFFLEQNSAISVCMKELAKELALIDQLREGDIKSRKTLASLLLECGFNNGGLWVAACLLSEQDPAITGIAGQYIQQFTTHSPWHNKAVHYYIDLLEHPDQEVRRAACLALGQLKAKVTLPQLKYMTYSDYPSVRQAASDVLTELGEASAAIEEHGQVTPSSPSTPAHLTPQYRSRRKKKHLQRPKSADFTNL